MKRLLEASSESKTVVIVGAGPAGLAAAHELQNIDATATPVVLEAGSIVGGIARTESHNGFRFDIGGHRFFTKVPEVEAFWQEILGNDFITVPRLSRIYYRHRFFDYPLRVTNALTNLGLYEAIRIMLSYFKWQVRPKKQEESFEEWVINRFGGRLYGHFFRSYTEKVWGIPPHKITADWAAQRIKNLSLMKVVWNAITGSNNTVSLIEKFQYPRLGPGMMWEKTADRIVENGGEVRMHSEAVRVIRNESRVKAIEVRSDRGIELVQGDHFINTMALRDLIERFDPPPPPEVREAAQKLKYRDFLIVTLILDHPDPFPDNWIYIHSPDVSVGRIQNFRAWSQEMLADTSKASIGMEYFCNEGDALWEMDDDALAAKAASELEQIGLAKASSVSDFAIIRQKKAYPVYDGEYQGALEVVGKWLKSLENFQTVGRNGLHRYNNQDHSMLTGMLAARNIAGEQHDVWSVNVDRAYHEQFERRQPDGTPAV